MPPICQAASQTSMPRTLSQLFPLQGYSEGYKDSRHLTRVRTRLYWILAASAYALSAPLSPQFFVRARDSVDVRVVQSRYLHR